MHPRDNYHKLRTQTKVPELVSADNSSKTTRE
jgi:hypothetical protein